MTMQCTNCRKIADYSPLRLGRPCGSCRIIREGEKIYKGKWIPVKKDYEAKI